MFEGILLNKRINCRFHSTIADDVYPSQTQCKSKSVATFTKPESHKEPFRFRFPLDEE